MMTGNGMYVDSKRTLSQHDPVKFIQNTYMNGRWTFMIYFDLFTVVLLLLF